LFGPVLVGSTRNADKKVFPGFTYVTGVDCPGFFDRIHVTEVVVYYRRNTLDFTTPALGARPRKHGASGSQKCRVFNESRIRVFVIRRHLYEFQATRFEGFAVCLVLSQRFVEVTFS
jgi:hypothetical protein